MPTTTILLADLPEELRALPLRDQEAMRRAVQRTLAFDAPRWIQWSIKGGGYGGATGWQRTTAKKPPAKRKKPSTIARVWAKIRTFFHSRHGKRPKVPAPIRAGAPCAPRKPPTYREPVDTGEYKNSWKTQILPDGAIFYSASHPPEKAGVIEYGRRPAPIPIEPLADWVRRKLGCNDPKKARSIAFAISKVASKKKREGLHVLERAHPKIAEALEANIARELKISAAGAGKAARSA